MSLFSNVTETRRRMREEMQESEILEIESIDSTHSQHSDEIDEISVPSAGVSALEQLEFLFKKLRIQFFFCFTGILLTILAYSIVRSNDQCCEFPFKESSCVAKSVLPPFRTNHSTLGEEIDEFIADSRAKVSTLHDAIQMRSLIDRQRTLDATKGELWKLTERHSANLAAFGAIKREDERMEELEVAITDGYAIFIFFSLFGSVYIFMLPWVNERSRSNLPQIDRVEEKSAEEDENSHNARMKKLKRHIPIFYLATLICILVQLGLYVTFLAGQYYSGSCPIYATIERIRRDKLKWGKTYLPKSFTNYTTYSDELIADSRAKVSTLNDAIQMRSLTDRQRTLDATKGELWKLAERHSANLAAFGAIKREDERMEELEVAITDGYAIFIFFSLFGSVYIFMLPWNARMKKLKRRIPIFYLATLICILVQLGLYVTFLAGQYYSVSCPIYATIESIRRDKLKWGKTYLPKSFTNYTTYSDELQLNLDLHLEELNKSMQSPTLEVRELGWNYEYKAIEVAFRHHTELKQYHVDRNSAMPRQISYAPQSAKCRFLMVIAITFDSIFIGRWVIKESAIW